MVGRVIGGFRVVELLGEGGMGSVWRAEDSGDGPAVALKLLPRQLADDPAARQRFLREARTLKELDHPGIAKLHDAGEDGGELYCAADFVEGRTVAQLVAASAIEVHEAVRIAADAAEALHHAHQRGVIHRDVSSSNVMVARDGRVVVIDFGLARLADASTLTSSSQTLGTVVYMSPEVVNGRPAGPSSDVYSLGVVLYEMLTGSRPFLADRMEAVLYAIAHDKPEAPSLRRPGIPRALDRLVLSALAREPDKRPEDASRWAADLRELYGAAVAETTERPASAGTPSSKPKRPSSSGSRARRRVRRLAVVPFSTIPSDPSSAERDRAMARAFADSLSAALGRVPGLEVITPERLEREGTGNGSPAQAAGRLGARWAVTGMVNRANDRLRVNYSIQQLPGGRQIDGDRLEASSSDAFELEDRLYAAVLRALELDDPKRRQPVGATSDRAHRQYVEALHHLEFTDDLASIDAAISLLQGLASEGASGVVHAALGKAYLRRAETTHDLSFTRLAEDSCRAALSLDAHAPDVLVTLGRLMLQTGRHDKAREALEQALELDGRNPDAWIYLSRLDEARGRLGDAESAAQKAMESAPSDWRPLDRLGIVRFRAGRYQGAVEAWERATALVPQSADLLQKLGSAHFLNGDPDRALLAYQRSVELQPLADAYSGLGTVKCHLGLWQEAIGDLAKACELSQGNPEAWANLGDAQRWTSGHQESSSRSFDRAIEIIEGQLAASRMDPERWALLGKWQAKRGQTAASLDSISRALHLAPQNANVLARAVTVFELAGMRDRALDRLEAAVRAGYDRNQFTHDLELGALREEERARAALSGS